MESERQRLQGYLATARDQLAANPEEAISIAGASIAGADVSDDQMTARAAWTLAARALINLDEFITRE